MNFSFYLTFLHINVACIYLNKNELQVSLALVEELKIRQCILLGFTKNSDFIIKQFSLANIQTTYLEFSSLIDYIRNAEIGYFHTGIILKDKNLSVLEQTSRIFEEKNEAHQWQKFIWLVFVENYLETNALFIPFDCEFILIKLIAKSIYKMTEIYTVNNKSFSLEFGTRDMNGLSSSKRGFYRRRENFQGVKLTMWFSDEWGHKMLGNINKTLEGFFGILNLTYDLNVCKSLQEASNNFRTNGDLYANPFPFGLGIKNTDSIGPVIKIILNWYIKYPKVELRSDYYLQPFDFHVWMLLLSTTLLGTVLSLLAQCFIPNKKRNLVDNLFLGLESFCNQSGNDEIKTGNLRSISISLRLTAIMSIALYGATITSYFAVETYKPPFTNLDEFMINGEYRFLLTSTNDLFTLVQARSFGANALEIYKNFSKFIPVTSFDELLDQICYGKYAITFEGNDINAYNLPCKYYKIPQFFGSYWYGILVRKNGPFKRIFNKNLIRFRENGMQSKWKMGIYGTSSTKEIKNDLVEPINFEQMTEVLAMPLIGILLSIGIIIVEIMYDYLRLRKMDRVKVFAF